MPGKKVLFICIHNSARSQIAEAFLKLLGGDRFEVHSAGLKAGELNPLAVRVMQEVGIDISRNRTKDVSEYAGKGQAFGYVITVCDAAGAEMCPVFPGAAERLRWSFEDPSEFTGTYEERLEKTRKVRDAIRASVESWLKTFET